MRVVENVLSEYADLPIGRAHRNVLQGQPSIESACLRRRAFIRRPQRRNEQTAGCHPVPRGPSVIEMQIERTWPDIRRLVIDGKAVRRQNIWRNLQRKLAECGPRLGVDVRRRACGVASADARWSSV